jgi:hypothetical protein
VQGKLRGRLSHRTVSYALAAWRASAQATPTVAAQAPMPAQLASIPSANGLP